MSGIFNAAIFNNQVFNTGVVSGIRPSGGIPETLRVRHGRTRRERAQDRKRYGIPDEVLSLIEKIAESQVERLENDAQKRFEELHRQLQLEEITWQARYLEVLNEIRARLIDEEIARHLKAKLEEEDIILIAALAAAL